MSRIPRSRNTQFGLLFATVVMTTGTGCSVTPAMEAELAADRARMVADVATLSAEEQRKAAEASSVREGQRKFAGLNFGVGVSLTIDTGDNDRVNGAQIVNDVVRVDDVDDTTARIMLESHYFFQPYGRVWNVKPGNWGVGPFIALQPGTDEIIEAVGAGIMLGFKRPDESGQSFNVGLGYVVDPNVQVLGDGFVENQAPPAGEEQVRFKETSQGGVLVLVSFGFE